MRQPPLRKRDQRLNERVGEPSRDRTWGTTNVAKREAVIGELAHSRLAMLRPVAPVRGEVHPHPR